MGDEGARGWNLEEMILSGWGPEECGRGIEACGRGHRNVGGGMGRLCEGSWVSRK